MKFFKSILLFIIVMQFVSCTPDSPSPTPVSPPASLSFTALGSNYTLTDADALLSIIKVYPTAIQAAGYSINAIRQNRFVIGLFMLTSSNLTTSTYLTNRANYPSGEKTVFNTLAAGPEYVHLTSTDFMSVIITKIEGGLASGTFTAQLSRPSAGGVAQITNGVFANIKITN